MYSESDLQSAVAAGAISADAADALRAHVAATQHSPAVDEEHFRLVTGFNDVFVSIACLLVIFAAAATGGALLGGLFVAAASWAMAEFFTRKRRMALPSIILLLAFAIGLGVAASSLAGHFFPPHEVSEVSRWNGQDHVWQRSLRHPWESAAMAFAAGLAAAIGSFFHWRRFHVPITIAAGTGAGVLLLMSTLAAWTNQTLGSDRLILPAAFLCGLGVFAFAMRWDLSDRARKTQRSDVAFWLHLLAAPLIAHPLFHWMGVTGGAEIGPATALGVLAIYGLFAVVALAVDRRALLVSALLYVLIAMAQLFRSYGAVELNVALTALLIGSGLLMLSAFWAAIRRAVLGILPAGWRERLPQAGR